MATYRPSAGFTTDPPPKPEMSPAERYRRYLARPWGKAQPCDARIARQYKDIEATGILE